MSTSIQHNKIATTLLGIFFCALLFLAPVSFTTQKHDHIPHTEMTLSVSSAAPRDAIEAIDNPEPQAKDMSSIGFLGEKVFSGLSQWLGGIMLSVPSAFLWVAGKTFDSSLNILVFGMGEKMQGGLGTAVNNSWVLIRDICNLAFIFGFVYVGIRTIIDPESASTKRFLSKIIIGALLINFSLFFVKFIVDFANFTAYQIYNTMTGGGAGSLSATIADKLGIITFFSSPSSPNQFASLTDGGMFWFFIFAAVLLFVVAFILFAASFLFITRFVGLVLIMVGSPILFGATVFPQTEHYAFDMWKKLISYAFFAPAFLLLLLISIKLIEGFGIVPNGNGFTEVLTKGKSPLDSYDVVLQFVIITFFFIQSLLIAQKAGIAGGEMATKYAGSLTAGVAARMGRATVGKVAHNWSESDGLKDAASKRGVGGWAARQALKTSRTVGDASFDARNVKAVSKTLGTGDGRKGGYKTVMGEVEKKEKEFATSLGEIGDDDVQVEARKKEWEAEQRNTKAEVIRLRQEMKNPALSATDRVKKQGEIDALEKKEKDAQIKYESEKQRRIIGSTYTNHSPELTNSLTANQTGIDAIESRLKAEWQLYSAPGRTEAEKKVARERIAGFKKGLKEQKEKRQEILKKSNDRGYAGVLESSKLYTAWPTGRLVTHEREAGKAIRKSTEKGLPKKKDD